MTTSQKSTDGSRSWAPSISIGGAVVLGFLLVLRAYRWSVEPSTIVLMVGWIGLVASAVLLWKAMLVVSADSSSALVSATRVSEGRRGDLEREKRALLRSIKDVEFDRDMGKMGAEDAQQIIRVYRARAIEIIKELDAGAPEVPDDAPIPDIIERELEARLGRRKGADAPAKPADEPDAGEAVAANIAPPPVERTCPGCDTANDADAAFCKKCGAKLEVSA